MPQIKQTLVMIYGLRMDGSCFLLRNKERDVQPCTTMDVARVFIKALVNSQSTLLRVFPRQEEVMMDTRFPLTILKEGMDFELIAEEQYPVETLLTQF